MASLNSVLEGPRKAGRSSYFGSFFADGESRRRRSRCRRRRRRRFRAERGAIAPLLTAEAAELGLKFFRWEGAALSPRARARSRLALSFLHSRARARRHPTARPRARAPAGITTRPRRAPRQRRERERGRPVGHAEGRARAVLAPSFSLEEPETFDREVVAVDFEHQGLSHHLDVVEVTLRQISSVELFFSALSNLQDLRDT